MEETQLEIFERENQEPPIEDISKKKDKEYYEVKTTKERFRKMKMENDLKARTLVYKSDVEDAWRENCEILQSFFRNFTEVVPFEAQDKSIEESLKLHIAAVEDCRQKLALAFEKYIQEKETPNA